MVLSDDLGLDGIQIEALDDVVLEPKDLLEILGTPNDLAVIDGESGLQDDGVSIDHVDARGALKPDFLLQPQNLLLTLPRLLGFEGYILVVKPNYFRDFQRFHNDHFDVGENFLDYFPPAQNLIADQLNHLSIADFVANESPELQRTAHQFGHFLVQ